jgi:hypothetical protein
MPGEDPANNPDGCEEIGDDDLRADTDSFWGGGGRWGYYLSRRYPLLHIVKEAQLVCIRLSFNELFEIFRTRRLAQFISTGVHSNKYKEKGGSKTKPRAPILLFVRDHGDL